MPDIDVFVFGGGPAGLAAAIGARRAGLTVLLADAEVPPIDKACGEGLMPDSLAAASHLGLSLPASAGFPFYGIRFAGPHHSSTANFPNGHGLGIRRTVLHPLMVEQAKREGVEMLWGTPARIDGSSITIGGRSVSARWIVGADGSQSTVRRAAGLDDFRRDSRRFGFRRHYQVAPWSNHVEVHWADGCQFYVTPVADNEVCVVLMSREQHLRIDDALPHFPALQEALGSSISITSERGSLAATRRLHRVTRGNVALIGDASGTVDPITGEGLCLAFHQAAALAGAFCAGDLSQYESAHANIGRRPRFMASSMLLLDRSANLRDRTLSSFAKRPELFANLLALHVGQLSASRCATTAALLGWEVVTA